MTTPAVTPGAPSHPSGQTTSVGVMRRGTLSRQLVVRVATLVALVAIALGAVSLVAVQRILLNQAQGQLVNALSVQDKGPVPDPDDREAQTAPHVRGINIPGLPPGTIVVTSNTEVRGGRITSGAIDAISGDLAQTLLRLPTGQPRQVNLPGYGEYLAEKVDRGYETDVVAIPLGGVTSVVNKLLALELALAAVAVAATALLSRALIARSLRPLNRLAGAATHVSNLELDRGEVSLAVRVPPKDSNPENEVGRVGHAFNHMLNNVEGALAARQASETRLRQFVADASHELRNPLAAIRGYSELVRRSREELPVDTAYAMGRIEAESGRMSKLVEDMLLLARLDNDPDLDLRPVDVVELVLNAVNDARVAGPDHTWRLALPDETVTARADANRLHQVVVNLLANARTHTPPGTAIETAVVTDGDWAVITVTDNGPGIDPSIKDVVFERFARADASRAHTSEGSTGLGLAIVAAVMDAHQGTATVDSRPGYTRFTLRLPLWQ